MSTQSQSTAPASATAPAPAVANAGPELTRIEYPLTSFASTPHNVSAISFLLGSLWGVGILLAVSNSSLLWSNAFWGHAKASAAREEGIWSVLHSPVLGLYLACWALFHLLEFLVTSMWNPNKLSVDSFLLNNGAAYHVAHFLGIVEHVLEHAYLPQEYRRYKDTTALVILGFTLVVGGQFLRSFAMITAAGNFSHIVAYKKLETHELVTSGIYSWSRHPSYAGFVWWALGTQVMLGNPIGFLAFSVVLYRFFSHRIGIEEQLLIQFFGDTYVKYRQKVPTRILFIR